MSRKTITLLALLAIGCVMLTGCKKKEEPVEFEIKTAEEYKADAAKDITPKNVETELEKMEREIIEDEKAERMEGL